MQRSALLDEGNRIYDDFADYLNSKLNKTKLAANIQNEILPVLEKDPKNEDIILTISKLFNYFLHDTYSEFNKLFAQFVSVEEIIGNSEKYLNQILALALTDLFENRNDHGFCGIRQAVYEALNFNKIVDKLEEAFGISTVRQGLLMAYIGYVSNEIVNVVTYKKFNGHENFQEEFFKICKKFLYETPYDRMGLKVLCDSHSQRNNVLRSILDNPHYQNNSFYSDFEEDTQSEEENQGNNEILASNSRSSSARIHCVIGGSLIGSGGGLGAGVGIGVLAAPPTGGWSLLYAAIVAASTVVGGLVCGVAGCIAAPNFQEPVNENKDGYKLLRPQSVEMENYGEKDTATLFSDSEQSAAPRASAELFTAEEDQIFELN